MVLIADAMGSALADLLAQPVDASRAFVMLRAEDVRRGQEAVGALGVRAAP